MSDQQQITTATQNALCARCGITRVADPAYRYCLPCWRIIRDEERAYPRLGPPPNRTVRRIVRLAQDGYGAGARPRLEPMTGNLAYSEDATTAPKSSPPEDACPIIAELALTGSLWRRVAGQAPYNAIVSLSPDRRGTTHGDPNTGAFYLAEVADLRYW